jgi:hypothetical protein
MKCQAFSREMVVQLCYLTYIMQNKKERDDEVKVKVKSLSDLDIGLTCAEAEQSLKEPGAAAGTRQAHDMKSPRDSSLLFLHRGISNTFHSILTPHTIS